VWLGVLAILMTSYMTCAVLGQPPFDYTINVDPDTGDPNPGDAVFYVTNLNDAFGLITDASKTYEVILHPQDNGTIVTFTTGFQIELDGLYVKFHTYNDMMIPVELENKWTLNNGRYEFYRIEFRQIEGRVGKGTLEVEGSVLQVHHCTFTECFNQEPYGDGTGGGISCVNCDYYVINNSVFTDCKAAQYGGAIYIDNSARNYLPNTEYNEIITDCTFNQGTALVRTPKGHGIYCKGGTAKISHCRFEDLVAMYGGAGIAAENAVELEVTNDCTFHDCDGYNHSGFPLRATGGAILCEGSGHYSVSDSSFSDCDALQGGAIYIGEAGGGTAETDEVTIQGLAIHDCKAELEAGGIFLNQIQKATLLGVVANDCEGKPVIPNWGIAVQLSSIDDGTIRGMELVASDSKYTGGAALDLFGFDGTVERCRIVDTIGGGGMKAAPGNAAMFNCIISDNDASMCASPPWQIGGALSCNYTSPMIMKIVCCALSDNKGNLNGNPAWDTFRLASHDQIELYSSLHGNIGATAGLTYLNQINLESAYPPGDPADVRDPNPGYALATVGADIGVNDAYLQYDHNGRERNSIIDIGPIEYADPMHPYFSEASPDYNPPEWLVDPKWVNGDPGTGQIEMEAQHPVDPDWSSRQYEYKFVELRNNYSSGWQYEPDERKCLVNVADLSSSALDYRWRFKVRFLNDPESETFFSQAGTVFEPVVLEGWPKSAFTGYGRVQDTSGYILAHRALPAYERMGQASTLMTGTSPAGAIAYQYRFKINGNYTEWQTKPEYLFVGLTPQTSYTIIAQRRNPEGEISPESNPVVITTPQAGSDSDPPTPNPMTWASALSSTYTSITMTATMATDSSGPVEYFFECVSGPGHDSGWIAGPTYTDTINERGSTSSYRVRVKDQHWNVSQWSETRAATLLVDTSPPSPDPMTWDAQDAKPYEGVIMARIQATEATDVSHPIKYYFECVEDTNFSSGWVSDRLYQVNGLNPGATYHFKVRAKDSWGNETAWSAELTVQTQSYASGIVRNTIHTNAWYPSFSLAIYEALDGHTLEISPGTHNEVINLGDKDLIVRGTDPTNWSVVESTIINGNGVGPVIMAGDGSECMLQGLTVTGVNDTTPNETHSAVHIESSGQALIQNCLIRDNRTNGAPAISGSYLTVENCRIENNTATGWYGAVSVGNSFLNACQFSGNSSGDYGGALTGDNLTVTDCSFTDNSTAGKGGAVRTKESTLTGCTFTSNTALDGGAVYVGSSSLPTTITNCIFSANDASGHGGGLYSWDEPVLTGCVFSANTTDGYGGAICHTNNRMTLLNCTIANNQAGGTGGGIYSDYGITVKNTVFWDNTATFGYPQIAGDDSYFYQHNYLTACAIQNGSKPYYILDGAGDAIGSDYGGTFVFADPLLIDAWHLGQGSPCKDQGQIDPALPVQDMDGDDRILGTAVDIGADEIRPDVTAPSPSPMSFSTNPYAVGSNSISMTATLATDDNPVEYFFDCLTSGGHDSAWQSSRTYVDTGLSPSTTYTYRVVARDSEGNSTAYSSSVSATTDEAPLGAAKNDNTGVWYSDIQQAIDAASTGHTIKVYPGTHTGSINFGGKVITLRGTNPNDWSTVESTILHGNGVAKFITLNSNATLEGLTITGCTDTGSWYGAVDCSGAPTIRRCLFRDNSTRCSPCLTGGGATVEDCRFENNSASYIAGAVGGSFILRRCEFTGNHCTSNGGALGTASEVTACTFTNNSSDAGGGAIYNNSYSGMTITDCTFTGNTAADKGGAIHTRKSTLINCVISGNTAANEGGGVYGYMYDLTMIGCVVMGNTAQNGDGGGVWQTDYDMDILNCTIINNSAPNGTGGGLYSEHGLTMKNTILWGNTADSYDQLCGEGSYFYEYFYLHSCCIENAYQPNSNIIDNDDGVIGKDYGGTHIFTNPQFTDDWHLASNSPCIDLGVYDGAQSATDIDGDARVRGAAVDIGADEY